MRLLRYGKDGRLSVTDDLVANRIPPYAILSHTWGTDDEEVTFDDLVGGTGKDKLGYKKIQLCGKQAKRDGLHHFWVDTCCINKANKAEHSLAIRSMFRWYRNAARCYVYLTDVSISPFLVKRAGGLPPWESEFRQSKWFTRGWTLQELLAPSAVDFFSRDWHKLGDRRSLRAQIHGVTTIPYVALEGAPLSQFDVDERFRWRQGRHTKLKEDEAYSLSGIFDVEMAPVYGEGTEEAFRRLRDEIRKRDECLRDLRPTDPRDDKKRIEDTQGGLLKGSYHWVLNNSSFKYWYDDPQNQLLWIKGDPGKGKTMLLCGIIDELQKTLARSASVSYFFCQATDSRINSATAVLRGLLYLLVSQQPALIAHVRKRYEQAGKAIFEDANAWIALIGIFADLLQDPNLDTAYILVDALDECTTDLPKLLYFIAKQSSTSCRVKWIVSSRNWPDIEAQLHRAGHKLSLELNAKSVATAVDMFIRQRIDQLAQEKQYKAEVRAAVLQHLTFNANGTFLWVALVCQDLRATPKWNVLQKLALFPPGLNSLYKRMIQQIKESDGAKICQQVLASVAVLYRPVSIAELVVLVEALDGFVDDVESVREIIGLCGSFLTVQEDIVYFVHQSAKDFLFTNASHDIYPSGIDTAHYTISSRSLQAMSKLHRDMYHLGELGYPVEQIKEPDPNPLAALRYSCIYWIEHLCSWDLVISANPSTDLQDGGAVYEFLKKKYLYWLEALSLCKSMSEGVASMEKLEGVVQGKAQTFRLLKLVRDARRFIMYHKRAIENSPLQAYASALLFSPARSLIRDLFKRELPNWITIKPAMDDTWSACLQTFEGHNNAVRSVAFSHDSALLASASYDKTIKVWDARSGKCLQAIEGHRDRVYSVVFSHNSAWLASASDDKTVKIWNVSNGNCLQTLEGHNDQVWSVAFSHDSAWLASASVDKTAKIWNVGNGKLLRTLEGHDDLLWSVAFSHDSARLASASDDKTIKIWDTSNGKCLRTLKGHSDSVRSVAFSHDSAWLASGSADETVRVWDANYGECVKTLEGHINRVNSVAFSHDSKYLASASGDKTIKIWDTSNDKCLHTLESHSDWVRSIVFSHDSSQLASGSDDSTAKIWDASNKEQRQTFKDHGNWIRSIASSHDSAWLISASDDKTVKIWDTGNCKCLRTLKGHSDSVRSAAFSSDLTQIASASYDKTVKIWDTRSGECLRTLKGHSATVRSATFSSNSAQIASASDDKTVKIWDAISGECLQTLEGHSDRVWSATFSADLTRLASASVDRTVKIWDAISGECLQTLEEHSDAVRSAAFSHNSAWLASASDDKTVKVWDSISGKCLQTFHIGCPLFNISFDVTASYLLTEVGTILINPPHVVSGSGVTPFVTDFQCPHYQGVGFSSDGAWITYNSVNLLWLPSEYRPDRRTISGKMIGIAVGSGKVWTCSIEHEPS